MMVNGILNIIFNLGSTVVLLISVLTGGLASFGIGCLCLPVVLLPLLPVALGIFEIVYGSRAMSVLSAPVRYGTLQTIVVLEMVCVLLGNVLSLIIGILNLIFLGEPEVKAYYGQA
jgi:hypothetical protein